MNDRVTVQIVDGVADVRLVRVDKMNALDDAMFSALIEMGERLRTEASVRAVVLSGEGRAFCAGLDMGSFAAMASGERNRDTTAALVASKRTEGGSNRAQHACMVWREIPVPVIAAVHGVAFGGGFQLALGADLRFVAADVKLAVLEIKWGLIPDMAGMVLMRGLVRDDVARELTYTGRIFGGEEAVSMGLATRVCADPRAEALALAAEIAAKNPHAIRAGKRLLNLMGEGDQHAILLAESQEQGALIGSANQVEAVMANLEKRVPGFADSSLAARQLEGWVGGLGEGGFHREIHTGAHFIDEEAGADGFMRAERVGRLEDLVADLLGRLADCGDADGFRARRQGEEGGRGRQDNDTVHVLGSGLRLLPTPSPAFP
jgi:enoyl-CoA hydratase/carnithine racemase